MLALRSPQDAYRRVDFDARVEGADPHALVALCYEQLIAGISAAIYANESSNISARSKAITRALAAVTALQMGVARGQVVAVALQQYYASIRRALLDSALDFSPQTLATIRQDLTEVAAALMRSR
jgi:flagellar protein FliS